ncbi:MAG: cyclic lactone autoinducer peptide [Oscillospiraceae bacterium]|nr:cyclic lactone autoinducer peptide [Oscillospiraceae bacterium]
MKKIKNAVLGLFGKIISSVCLFAVSMSVGTISLWGPYEPEMPESLVPKNGG